LLDEPSAHARREIECAHARHLDRLAHNPRVRRCRVLGTVAAFDLDGEAGYLSEAAQALGGFALGEGVLLRPLGNVVYLLPPYCATAEDLALAYDVIERFLTRAAA
jgi:adenosylmethionine-8-amino-7-oxononanoate aminotransferase